TRHSGSESGRPVAFRLLDDIVGRIPVPTEERLYKAGGN
ncbi:MAG TPA: magnesium chelatase, partial [Clostridiaceae bacterium]|nr:magnesium chelatase [Clostridiaceae bacterium]